jgi:hypothetical protein
LHSSFYLGIRPISVSCQLHCLLCLREAFLEQLSIDEFDPIIRPHLNSIQLRI